jgi:hypothetical protein
MPGRDFALPAASAAGLLRQLNEAVHAAEAQHGVLWSEASLRFGEESDRRTGLGSGGDMLGPEGAQMYGLLKNLPLNGYERSFKMQPGRLLPERFLLGIRRDALLPEQFAEIVDRLCIPAPFRAALAAAMPRTSFLHFGHEAGDGGSVRKVYQEFIPGGVEPDLLYLGYKWDPADPTRRMVSRYRLLHGLGRDGMRARIGAVHGACAEDMLATTAIVDLALARSSEDALLYVEVSEEGNPRLSYDINLYAAGLRIADVATIIGAKAARLGILPGAWEAQLGRMRGARIGHVSGGTGRDGQSFLTVYWLPRTAPAS